MELREAQRIASKTYAEDPAAAAAEVDGKVKEPDPISLTVSTDPPRQGSSGDTMADALKRPKRAGAADDHSSRAS